MSPTSGRSTPNRQKTVTFHWSFSVGPWEGTLGSDGICTHHRVHRQASPPEEAVTQGSALPPPYHIPSQHALRNGKERFWFSRKSGLNVWLVCRESIYFSSSNKKISRMVPICPFGGSFLQATAATTTLKGRPPLAVAPGLEVHRTVNACEPLTR